MKVVRIRFTKHSLLKAITVKLARFLAFIAAREQTYVRPAGQGPQQDSQFARTRPHSEMTSRTTPHMAHDASTPLPRTER
jgi:hypothetical protein